MKFQRPNPSDLASTLRSTTGGWGRLVEGGIRVVSAIVMVGVVCQFQACPGPKPATEPAASPSPSPVPTATPTPAPSVDAVATPAPPRYNGVQQAEYIKTAQGAFIEARGAKAGPFAEANAAFAQAGGASAKGLTSKPAISERRAMIEKCRQANEDYLTFVTTQDNTYRDALAQTPLVAGDVDGLVADFSEKAKGADVKKLRETERDLLKTADDMMAFLDKTYGAWTLNGNRPAFKKAADNNEYATLSKKYNGLVEIAQKLQASVNAPLPTPSESPIPSVPATPGASVPPPATVSAPAASPKA